MNGLGYLQNYGNMQPQYGYQQQYQPQYQPPIQNYQLQQLQQQQARLQQLEAMSQPPQQIPPLAMVNGEAGAKAYNIPPNTSIVLLDTHDDYLYMKQSDANGLVSIRKFQYIEVKDGDPVLNETKQTVKVTKYATIEELNLLKDKIDELSKELGVSDIKITNDTKQTKENNTKSNAKGVVTDGK